MRLVLKSAVVASMAGAGLLVAPALASADPGAAPEKKTQPAKFFDTLPEAPLECADWWDPIEDTIEEDVDLTKIPVWAQESFEAFDEWCEAPAEAKEKAEEAKKKESEKTAGEKS